MPLGPTLDQRPTSVIVSPWSYEGPFGDATRRAVNTAGYASTAWGTANTLGLFFPVMCETPFTIVKFWTHNGATANGNVDVGLYSDSFTRLLSTTPTAQSGTSVLQDLDVTDTTFPAGRYYIALALTSATGTIVGGAATTKEAVQAAGAFQVNTLTSGTLPSSVTPAVFATLLLVPNFGFSQRTLVA